MSISSNIWHQLSVKGNLSCVSQCSFGTLSLFPLPGGERESHRVRRTFINSLYTSKTSEKFRRALERREQSSEQDDDKPQAERKPRRSFGQGTEVIIIQPGVLGMPMQHDRGNERVDAGHENQEQLEFECRVRPIHERIGEEEFDSGCEIDQEADDYERQESHCGIQRHAAQETQDS